MSALGGEGPLAGAVVQGRELVQADRGGGLEGDAEEDGHAVGDAALDAARVVGLGVEARGGDAGAALGGLDCRRGHEGVVVAAAQHLRAAPAGADLETPARWDRHHGVGERGLQLIEAGLSEARRYVAHHAGDGAAGAVVGVAQLGDALLHAAGGICVWAADGEEGVDCFSSDGVHHGEEGRVGAQGIDTIHVVEELNLADG